ncbi:ac108 [Hemileuca sp. nucleopolyhedrovirus]|uniref:Ac108 n=1 Tax=Hemileuca sp. nucleopolyhedrovirus TaxID=1367203 RepID=S5N9C4_9ABAC|nr:ac108 [Hemileuca sp. nucleopolyhedrovirus]AGR56847.1 ac108 [Hemileuca sp. nucleopolyhedrovirus]
MRIVICKLNAKMRRTANTALGAVPSESILDYDQLQQIVSRNKIFLRDFILIVCCIIVFVILIVFILFIVLIAKNMEQLEIDAMKRHKTLMANLDYRNIGD